MAEAPATRASLIARLHHPDDDGAWRQFVELYAPVIHGYGRRKGLQDADAADLTQDVLQAVARGVAKLNYDPALGSFRGWLFTLVRNKLHDRHRRQQRQVPVEADTATQALLQALPAAESTDENWWDQEAERRLLFWAADQVRPNVAPTTWQAFWQTAVEGRTAAEAAQALGLSVAAVYMARSRVTAQLKEIVREIEGDDRHA